MNSRYTTKMAGFSRIITSSSRSGPTTIFKQPIVRYTPYNLSNNLNQRNYIFRKKTAISSNRAYSNDLKSETAEKRKVAILQTLQYHETTKHDFHRYARSRGYLDWETQPNPFRQFKNIPTLGWTPKDNVVYRAETDIDSGNTDSEKAELSKGKDTGNSNEELSYDDLYDDTKLPKHGSAKLTGDSLAEFFRYSMALSAWKQAGPNTWPLRVNPSSGNLHPTESEYLILFVLNHLSIFILSSLYTVAIRISVVIFA